MARLTIVTCDVQMEGGTCAQQAPETVAEAQGWDLGKFADFCPTHNVARRYRGRGA